MPAAATDPTDCADPADPTRRPADTRIAGRAGRAKQGWYESAQSDWIAGDSRSTMPNELACMR
jgi:hypothetical protein